MLLAALLGWFGPDAAHAQVVAPDPALARLVVHAAVPAPEGWVWLATDRGVFRYDGHQLVPLAALAADASLLARRVFATALLDSAGTLWLGGAQGLFAYAGGQLRAVRLPAGPAMRGGVTALETHGGALWVGTNADPLAVWRLDLRRPGRPPRVVLRHATGSISGFVPDSAGGGVLAFGYGRTWRLPAAGGPAVPLATRHTHHGTFTSAAGVRRWVPLGRHLPLPGWGGRWRVGFDGLYAVEANGRERRAEAWPPLTDFGVPPVLRVVELDSTWYWSSANRVLSVSLRHRAGERPRVRQTPVPLQFGRELVLVRVGRAALLGFRRDAAGAVRLAPDRRAAAALAVTPPLALSTRAFGRLPDGRLYLSTYRGVFTQAADSPAAPLRRWRTEAQAGVWFAALPLPGRRRLLANELGHFDVLTPAGRQTRLPWAGPHPPLAATNGLCLLRDRAGRYWGGCAAGLFEIDVARGQVRRYREADAGFVLHGRRIEQLAEGPAGVLWAATDDGLFRLVVASGAAVRFGPGEPAPRRLPTASIRCVLVAHPDSVWVGTFDAGLLLLRPGRGVVRRLDTGHGLPSESVAALLLAPPGRTLWAGTHGGLVGYDPRRRRLRVLTMTDGLATDELNRQSMWYDSAAGHLYAGGVGGASRVDLRRPLAAPPRPPLLLTALRQHHAALDQTITTYPPPGTAPALVLNPGDAFLDLDLALPDFAPDAPARLAYRLLGTGAAAAATRWLALGDAGTLRLQNLAPGRYTLEISGQTAVGTLARNGLRLPLAVRQPWQRRPETWAGLTALVAGLLGAVAYARGRAAAARRAAESRLRARLAADLHDEVGALLTRIALQAELLQVTLPAPTPRLTDLIAESRLAVTTVRDIIWSVSAEADTVDALADRLRDLLDQTDYATTWHTEFAEQRQPPDLRPGLRSGLRQHAYLIAKEAVTNALKHGTGTHLRLRLDVSAERLILTVQNNGAALPTPTRTGQGLRNMRNRAQQLGATLVAGPDPTGGWLVVLHVPRPLG